MFQVQSNATHLIYTINTQMMSYLSLVYNGAWHIFIYMYFPILRQVINIFCTNLCMLNYFKMNKEKQLKTPDIKNM